VASIRITTHVKASPEHVFDLWTNLDRMREWIRGVTRVSDVSGPVAQAGTTYTAWFGKMASPTTVLEAERPRRFRTRFGNGILAGESWATFEPDGRGGTNLVQGFETHGFVAGISARIFAVGSYPGSFRGELKEFVRIAEREP